MSRRLLTAALISVVVAALEGCERGHEAERTRPDVYTVRYEVDVCPTCARDPITEITYTPYWRTRWGGPVGIRLVEVTVPWSYTFRTDHLDDLTVRARATIVLLECRVFVDGKQVAETFGEEEIGCGAQGESWTGPIPPPNPPPPDVGS